MENVKFEVKGSTLTITIDLSVPGTADRSGKSTVLASTRGNKQVQEGVFMGVNVYKKR